MLPGITVKEAFKTASFIIFALAMLLTAFPANAISVYDTVFFTDNGLCVEGADMVCALEALRYGLSRKQSLDAIYSANPWMQELFSVSSLYRWNSEELLEGITKLDNVEIVNCRTRDKPRKGEYAKSCIVKEDLEGRRYEDFIALPFEERANTVQMDTVLGRKEKDTQCILSFQWKDFRF